MSQPNSQKYYEGHLAGRSLILNLQNPERMRSREPLFLDEAYFRSELRTITEGDDSNPGRLLLAKEELETAKEKWERWNNAQMLPKKEPHSQFAEGINFAAAVVTTIKKEIKVLKEIIEQYESKRVDEQKQKDLQAIKRKLLIGKMKDGKLVKMDGRRVLNGKFIDNGQSVEDYIEEVRKERQVIQKKKIEQEKKSLTKV